MLYPTVVLAPIFLILTCSTLSGQDSSDQSSGATLPRSIDWSVTAEHRFQDGAWNVPVDDPRPNLSNAGGQTPADIPHFHGATFLKVGADVEVVAGAHLDVELVAEHRGISYGVYATDEMIVFPRILMSFDTTFTIAGETFRAVARVGNESDIRWGEGLAFYNMDAQGASIGFGWRSLAVWRRHIGDAVFGLGLNIGDADELGVGVVDLRLADSVQLNLELGFIDYFGSGGDGTSLSVGLQVGSMMRLYAQYEKRDDLWPVGEHEDRSAFVTGASGSVALGILEVGGRAEWRHYDAGYNRDRTSRSRLYRGAGSTIGPHLYPLDFYARPFSQWGVFTEYQGFTIEGTTLQLNSVLRLPYGFFALLNVDLNHLRTSQDRHDFDFFDAGIGWSPSPGTALLVSYTNRYMDLDRPYPTISPYVDPVLMYTMRVSIPGAGADG